MCGGDKCKADNDRPFYDPTGNSALERIRCDAGTEDGHHVDSTTPNTYRAYRFVGGGMDMLYAEFTAVTDWNFTAPDLFVEVFDVSKDPGQLHNLANVTSVADHAMYHAMLEKQFRCSGAACTWCDEDTFSRLYEGCMVVLKLPASSKKNMELHLVFLGITSSTIHTSKLESMFRYPPKKQLVLEYAVYLAYVRLLIARGGPPTRHLVGLC
jgi:hypothetical protein